MSRLAAVLRSVGPRLTVAAVALFALGLGGALVTPLPGDAAVLAAVAETRSPNVTTAARLVTLLGDLWVLLLVAVAVAVVVRNSRRAPQVNAVLLLAIGGSTLIVGALKLVTDRARPLGALATSVTAAYPSGHGTRAAVVFGLALWACHHGVRRRHRRVALVVVTGVVAAAIAVSRVYLGVHRPSEVLAGMLIGGAWVAAVLWVTGPAVGSVRTGQR